MQESIHPSRRMPKVSISKLLSSFSKNREVRNLFSLTLGALSASIGLESFLIPNSFIDGGITGISLIVNEFSQIPLAFLIAIFNLPFLVLAFRAVGKKFALRSILGILLLSTFVYTLHFPEITDDHLLGAAFGGFFLGLGIGLAIRGGAIIDGTEVLAIFLSRKTGLSVGNIIMIFNLLLFSVAAYLLSTEVALYAILTYFAASKTVDFVIDGIEGYVGVTIISERSELMRSCIVDVMGRGCTIYKGLKGYVQNGEPLRDTNIVYTVITRLEVAKIMAEIDKVDDKAFVIMSSIKDAKGGMIKKKPISNME
ncbi:MAG: YitT family protein [Bacteroidota bacterium]